MEKPHGRNKIITTIMGITFLIIGGIIFFYPNFRERNTQRKVEQIIAEFESNYHLEEDTKEVPIAETEFTIEGFEIKDFRELYDEMQNYNKSLITEGQNIVDAWNYEEIPLNLTSLNKEESSIGYIDIPDMKARLPLFLGASRENLAKGAAVLSRTSMPIGGKNTNCVIAGHRGWKGSRYFQYIDNLEIGSLLYITNPWETLVYKVTDMKIVHQTEGDSVMIQEGKDMVTLISCHPYGLVGSSYRYLAFAERVEDVELKNTSEEIKQEDVNKSIVTDKTDSEIMSKEVMQREKGDFLIWESRLRIFLPLTLLFFSILTIFIGSVKNRKKNNGRTV